MQKKLFVFLCMVGLFGQAAICMENKNSEENVIEYYGVFGPFGEDGNRFKYKKFCLKIGQDNADELIVELLTELHGVKYEGKPVKTGLDYKRNFKKFAKKNFNKKQMFVLYYDLQNLDYLSEKSFVSKLNELKSNVIGSKVAEMEDFPFGLDHFKKFAFDEFGLNALLTLKRIQVFLANTLQLPTVQENTK